MGLDIFIYGKDAFAKDVNSVLVKSNVKYKIDAMARVERIASSQELKDKIARSPDDIYLIEESKIIKKGVFNKTLGLFSSKDGIEEEFLKRYDIAKLDVSSYKELASYINNKLEDLQADEFVKLEEQERASLKPAIENSKSKNSSAGAKGLKSNRKSNLIGQIKNDINKIEEVANKEPGAYVATYKRDDDFEALDELSEQQANEEDASLSTEDEGPIAEPNFDESEMLPKEEINLNQGEEEKIKDLDNFLHDTLSEESNDLEVKQQQVAVEQAQEVPKVEAPKEPQKIPRKVRPEKESSIRGGLGFFSEGTSLEEAQEEATEEADEDSQVDVQEEIQNQAENIQEDKKEQIKNKKLEVNKTEANKTKEAENIQENIQERPKPKSVQEDKKEEVKPRVKLRAKIKAGNKKGSDEKELDTLSEEEIRQALLDSEIDSEIATSLAKKDIPVSTTQTSEILELDANNMDEFFKNFKKSLGDKDVEITLKVKK